MKNIILKLALLSFSAITFFACKDENHLSDTERPVINPKEALTPAEENSGMQTGTSASNNSNNVNTQGSRKWTAKEVQKFRFFLLDKKEMDNMYQNGLNGSLDLNGQDAGDLSVLLFDKDGKLIQETKVDKKGKFKFNKLDPSAYSLVLSNPDLNVNAQVQAVDDDGNMHFLTNKDSKSANHTAVKEKKGYPFNQEKIWTPEQVKQFRFYALEKSKSNGYSNFGLNGHVDGGADTEDLSVLLFDGKGKQVQKAKVDKNGNFSFKKLKPSEYSMVLSKPDLKVNADVQVVDTEDAKDLIVTKSTPTHSNLTEKSKVINVGDRLAEMEVEERLLNKVQKDPSKTGTYDVKGKLVRGNSMSAAITPVYLVNDKGEIVDKKVTDQEGNFTFNKLENGNYNIVLEKPNPDIKANLIYEYKDASVLVAPFTANQILTQKEIDALPNALVEESSFMSGEADLKGKVFKNATLKNQKEESLWLVDEHGKLIKSASYDKDGLFIFDHTKKNQYQVVMEGATPEQATLDIIAPEQSYDKEFPAKNDSNLVTLLSKPLILKSMKDHNTNAAMNVRESQQTSNIREAFRLYQLAVGKVKRDDYEGAKADLVKALELRPDYVDAYILHGKACELTKKYDDAIADYNSVLEFRPNHLTAMYRRAYLENEKGQYDRAKEDFTKVITIYPDFSYPYFYRGVAENQLNQQQLAIDDYQRMINIDSTEQEAFFNKGSSFFQLGKYDDAIFNYNKALKIDSLNPDVYYNRGQVYQIRGDYPTALSDFDKAIQLGPIRNAYFEKGNTYSMMKDEISARKFIEEGVAAFPNDGESYSQRGIYRYNHSELEPALDDFNKAISLNATNGEYYFKRGIVYAELNKKDDACNDFIKAKSLNYTDPEEQFFWKKYCKNVKQ